MKSLKQKELFEYKDGVKYIVSINLVQIGEIVVKLPK